MTARDPVAAARALLEKATPGPWIVWKGHAEVFAGPAEVNNSAMIAGHRRRICECDEPSEAKNKANAALIAAAPALLGELAAEVERLRGENERLLNLLTPEYENDEGEGSDSWCAITSFEGDECGKTWAIVEGLFNSRDAAKARVREALSNPWPGHPVIEPDPAEAAQAEERARIEALAREDSEQSRLRSERDLDELRAEGIDPESLGDEA